MYRISKQKLLGYLNRLRVAYSLMPAEEDIRVRLLIDDLATKIENGYFDAPTPVDPNFQILEYDCENCKSSFCVVEKEKPVHCLNCGYVFESEPPVVSTRSVSVSVSRSGTLCIVDR